MSTKCVSIVVVYNGLDLLQHYLRHYDRIGVDEMLIAVGMRSLQDMLAGSLEDRANNLFPEIVELAKPYRAKLYPFAYDRYQSMDKIHVERNILQSYGIGEDEYVMWTDLDEFFSFPCPLNELIDAMDRRNDWAIHGWILDRVAADGSFPAIRSETSIEAQFPIGCDITGRFLNANTRKIMIARGRVRVNEGHDDTEAGYWQFVPVGSIDDYTAHHFRWSNGIATKIIERLRDPQVINPKYEVECRQFMEYFNANGRIDLNDPIFAAHPAKPIRYFDRNGGHRSASACAEVGSPVRDSERKGGPCVP